MRLLRDVNTRAVRTELDHEDAEGLALVWREDGNAGKIVVVVGDLLFGEVANGVILLRLAVRGDVEENWGCVSTVPWERGPRAHSCPSRRRRS